MRVTWTVGKKLLTGIGVLVGLLLLSNTYTFYIEKQGMAQFDVAAERANKIRLEAKLKRLAFELYAGEKILILAGYDRDDESKRTWQERNTKALTDYKAAADELLGKLKDPTDIDNLKKRDRKSTRLNSSHTDISRMPSSA